MKKIGENIRFYRNLRGLTQTALAKQVEVAPAYISQIEANQRVPSLKVTRRIASVLGIEASVLVREAEARGRSGRLSASEKLDMLRTLIVAVEAETREERAASDTPTLEARGFVATELYSEPAFCLVLREFTASSTFGREIDDLEVESHTVLDGRVRLADGEGDAPIGTAFVLGPETLERPVGTRGARVLSVYSPRLPLATLRDFSESEAARRASD
ncbi:MAG: helix-turn-helix transcriptional regulator [bacterium]